MIAVVDYGMGNLRNVERALAAVGYKSEITADPSVLERAEKIILPGVGAFGEAVKRIDALNLRHVIMTRVACGVPLLGICLGMQLLYEESEESPGAKGLGLLAGSIRKFSSGLKVPHVGWNDVTVVKPSTILNGEDAATFYFVHSFYAPLGSDTIGRTDYGETFSSAVQKDNVAGVQFHPEKSQRAGLALLGRFAALHEQPKGR